MKITPRWIRTKFEKQRGDDPYAKLWEELPSDSQSFLLEKIELEPDEIPICAITALPNPVVITTERVVWRVGESARSLPLSELASCQAPERAPMSKLDMSKVVISTRSGEKYVLETAPGTTLFVLWNLLLKFTRPRAHSHGMET